MDASNQTKTTNKNKANKAYFCYPCWALFDIFDALRLCGLKIVNIHCSFLPSSLQSLPEFFFIQAQIGKD